MKTAFASDAIQKAIARRICRRVLSRRFKSAGHDDAPARRAIWCASSRNSACPSSKTPSTAFSATKRRWQRWRPIAASCSTACRRRCAGTGDRFHRFTPRLRERINGLGAVGRMDRFGFCVGRLDADDGRRNGFRTGPLEADRRGTRQQMAASIWRLRVQANIQSYHLWLTLPPHWRSLTFVAAAARRESR